MHSSHFEWRHLYRKQGLINRRYGLRNGLRHAIIELLAIEAELACQDESAVACRTGNECHQPIDNTLIGVKSVDASVDGSVDKNQAKQARRNGIFAVQTKGRAL